MIRTITRLSAAVLFLAAGVGQLGADTVIDTIHLWNGSSGVGNFGNPNTATYGQTITVPTDGNNTLDSFTFEINGPSTQVFQGYVFAWDGNSATGAALYESAVVGLAGTGGFEAVTFNTGGIALTPGSLYVLFASVSEVFQISSGTSRWGQTQNSDTYSGGEFVFINNGDDEGQWISGSWTTGFLGTGSDLAFRASFSETAVPEPASLAMAGTAALVGLVVAGRRRARS